MKKTCTHSPTSGNLWTPRCMLTKLGEHWVLRWQNTEAFGGIRDLQWTVVHKLGVKLASQNTCMNNSGHSFKGFTGPPTAYLWPSPQSSYTNPVPSAHKCTLWDLQSGGNLQKRSKLRTGGHHLPRYPKQRRHQSQHPQLICGNSRGRPWRPGLDSNAHPPALGVTCSVLVMEPGVYTCHLLPPQCWWSSWLMVPRSQSLFQLTLRVPWKLTYHLFNSFLGSQIPAYSNSLFLRQ